MRVLVTYAVEAEFAPWRKLRTFERIHTSTEAEIFRTQIGRAVVEFVVTGIGVNSAYRVTQAVLAEPHQLCITAGFAGSLREQHSVGHILAADGVQLLGKAKTLSCSRNLTRAAQMDGAQRVKLFLTADHVVRTVGEKRELAPFADAVEMESFGVISAAVERNVPAVAIRVISDDVRKDMPAMVEKVVDEKGRVKVGSVVRSLARHPVHLSALIRLGRDSKTAAQALAHFLEAYLKKLSFETHGWPPPELEDVAAR